MKKILLLVLIFILGMIVGAIIFNRVQPRGVWDIKECRENCLKPNEYAGLIGSLVMQNMPGILPKKVMETDKTVVVDVTSKDKLHYVAIPKYDIKNLGEYSSDQKDYLDDAIKCLTKIINEKNLKNYQIYSYGPGLQDVAYRHFHLVEYK